MFLLPPSPFPPSAPVLFSVSLCVSQRFMDDLCFRARSSENLLLARRVFLTFRRLILLCFILSYAPSFTVPAFGARIILDPLAYYSGSREECFSLSVGLFHFALFGLRSLLRRSCLRRPYYSRSACVSQRFMDDLCFRVRSSENLLLTRRVFPTFRRLILLYSKLRTLLHRSRLRRSCSLFVLFVCIAAAYE